MPDHPSGEETSDDREREVPASRNREREAKRRRIQRERAATQESRRHARRLDEVFKELKETETLLELAVDRDLDVAAVASMLKALMGDVPVSIYLSDERIHEKVEASVEQWLAEADVAIDARHEPVLGSWFRRLEGSVRRAAKTPAGREALLTATHVADSHLVQTQDAYVTATLLQNVGPVLQALQPTKDAVVRAGALLIVKSTG